MIGAAMQEREARGAAPSLDRSTKSPTPTDFGHFEEKFELYDENKAGKYLTIKRGAWNPESYQATVVTQLAENAKKPPVQSGDRVTERISPAAKKKIEQAALFSAAKGEGMRTFATLTLTPEWRAQLEKWDAMPRYVADDVTQTPWGAIQDGNLLNCESEAATKRAPKNLNKERRSLGNLVAEFINVLQQRHRNGLTLKAGLVAKGKIKNRVEALTWETAEGVKYPVEVIARWQPLAMNTKTEKVAGNYKQYEIKTGSHKADLPKYWFLSQDIDTNSEGKRARFIERKAGHAYPVEYAGEFTEIKYPQKAFSFIWVIEMPINDKGERNPHVHLMMNWQVKKHQFTRWAHWMESAWGKGWVKLQKLRKPESAAAYMAKAANYIGKGTDGSQGEVRGNRYSISKNAKAPQANELGRYMVTDQLRDCMEFAILERYTTQTKYKKIDNKFKKPHKKWMYKDGEKRELYPVEYLGEWSAIVPTIIEKEEETQNKAVYFTKYSFGATTRKAWGKLCTALKGGGHTFEKLQDDSPHAVPYSFARMANGQYRFERDYNSGFYISEDWTEAEGFYITDTTEKQYFDQLAIFEAGESIACFMDEYSQYANMAIH